MQNTPGLIETLITITEDPQCLTLECVHKEPMNAMLCWCTATQVTQTVQIRGIIMPAERTDPPIKNVQKIKND